MRTGTAILVAARAQDHVITGLDGPDVFVRKGRKSFVRSLTKGGSQRYDMGFNVPLKLLALQEVHFLETSSTFVSIHSQIHYDVFSVSCR